MSYSSVVLADNPLAYWRMGATLSDTSGNSRHGTLVNAPATVAGPFPGSTASRFDGTTQYGVIEHNAWMDIQVLTIELWVRWLATPGENGSVIARGVQDSPLRCSYRILRNAGTNSIISGYYDGNTLATNIDTIPLSMEVWTYYTAVFFPSGNVVAYKNSTVVGSTSTTGRITPITETNLYIGAEQSRRYINADIAEVAMYDYVLPVERIEAHYEAAFAPQGGLLLRRRRLLQGGLV